MHVYPGTSTYARVFQANAFLFWGNFRQINSHQQEAKATPCIAMNPAMCKMKSDLGSKRHGTTSGAGFQTLPESRDWSPLAAVAWINEDWYSDVFFDGEKSMSLIFYSVMFFNSFFLRSYVPYIMYMYFCDFFCPFSFRSWFEQADFSANMVTV